MSTVLNPSSSTSSVSTPSTLSSSSQSSQNTSHPAVVIPNPLFTGLVNPASIPVIPTLAMSTTTLSVNTLPVLGTKQAPEKFRGDYTKVDHLIKHFERLLAQHNVTDAAEKCQSVILYCLRSVVEFIQALDNYITPDWDLLKKDIKDFYDADLDITRYKVKDLTAYVKKTKKAKMGTLSTWKKYARGFI